MFTAAHYVYLLRLPLLCGLTLGAFGPVAYNTNAASLLSGMFDLAWWPVVLVSMCAAWLATACFLSTLLVLRYGEERFGVKLTNDQRRWSEILALVFYLAAAVCFLIYVWSNGPGWASTAIGLGLLLWAVTVGLVQWLSSHNVGMGWNRRVTSWLLFTPEGYTEDKKTLLDLHGRALAVALASHAIYVALGLLRGFALTRPETTASSYLLELPTLACVLLLVTLICWTGGALTFFLDRFRIPVIVLVIVFLAVAGRWPQSDHFFDVTTRQASPPALLPADVLTGKGDSAIIVAVSGGGIQAAAWSARVLTGLQEESKEQFAPAVRLISSVSGGSVGTMHFLGAYRRNELDSANLPKVFARATASSLDDVAWGMIYPDLLRLVFPFLQPRGIGRGWALERAWAKGRSEFREPLAAWREQVRAGAMPAVMFNATVVETGARVVFSTVDRDGDTGKQAAHTFYEVHKQHFDVMPVTAARLSATFPYVSPAARANAVLPKSQRFHFVDGGYWDNFGVASAIEFIQQAIVADKPAIHHLLFIQIRDRKTGDLDTSSGYRGGLFQTIAPPQTLYNVRGNGQLTRNAQEVELLRRYLEKLGVTMTTVEFENPQERAPLSWHLTHDEIKSIGADWDKFVDRKKKGSNFCRTLDFLRSTPAGGAIVPCS